MNSHQPLGLERESWMPIHRSRRVAAAPAASAAESLQRTGKRMVIAGFVVTIAGVVAYCAVNFAGGVNADMGDLLLRNSVPFATATLAVLGLGTLLWLIGSFTYLRGAMEADDDGAEGAGPAAP